MAFSPVPLKILTPEQANPLAAALSFGLKTYPQVQEAKVLPQQLQAALMQQQQKALQEKERTPYVPLQEMTSALGKVSPYYSTTLSHPFGAGMLYEIAKHLPKSIQSQFLNSFPGITQEKSQPKDKGARPADAQPVPGYSGVFYSPSTKKYYGDS